MIRLLRKWWLHLFGLCSDDNDSSFLAVPFRLPEETFLPTPPLTTNTPETESPVLVDHEQSAQDIIRKELESIKQQLPGITICSIDGILESDQSSGIAILQHKLNSIESSSDVSNGLLEQIDRQNEGLFFAWCNDSLNCHGIKRSASHSIINR